MNTTLRDLLDFMNHLAEENNIPFDDTPECLESWRQALKVWHEDGIATLEEVEAFDNYITTLGE